MCRKHARSLMKCWNWFKRYENFDAISRVKITHPNRTRATFSLCLKLDLYSVNVVHSISVVYIIFFFFSSVCYARLTCWWRRENKLAHRPAAMTLFIGRTIFGIHCIVRSGSIFIFFRVSWTMLNVGWFRWSIN